MEFLVFLGKMIATMFSIVAYAIIATFFIAMFNADGVVRAIELFKGIFGG